MNTNLQLSKRKKCLLLILLMLSGNFVVMNFGYILGPLVSKAIWLILIIFICITLRKKLLISKSIILLFISFLILVYFKGVFRTFDLFEFLSLTIMFFTSYLILNYWKKRHLIFAKNCNISGKIITLFLRAIFNFVYNYFYDTYDIMNQLDFMRSPQRKALEKISQILI